MWTILKILGDDKTFSRRQSYATNVSFTITDSSIDENRTGTWFGAISGLQEINKKELETTIYSR
jgi:hypothetical protein